MSNTKTAQTSTAAPRTATDARQSMTGAGGSGALAAMFIEPPSWARSNEDQSVVAPRSQSPRASRRR